MTTFTDSNKKVASLAKPTALISPITGEYVFVGEDKAPTKIFVRWGDGQEVDLGQGAHPAATFDNKGVLYVAFHPTNQNTNDLKVFMFEVGSKTPLLKWTISAPIVASGREELSNLSMDACLHPEAVDDAPYLTCTVWTSTTGSFVRVYKLLRVVGVNNSGYLFYDFKTRQTIGAKPSRIAVNKNGYVYLTMSTNSGDRNNTGKCIYAAFMAKGAWSEISWLDPIKNYSDQVSVATTPDGNGYAVVTAEGNVKGSEAVEIIACIKGLWGNRVRLFDTGERIMQVESVGGADGKVYIAAYTQAKSAYVIVYNPSNLRVEVKQLFTSSEIRPVSIAFGGKNNLLVSVWVADIGTKIFTGEGGGNFVEVAPPSDPSEKMYFTEINPNCKYFVTGDFKTYIESVGKINFVRMVGLPISDEFLDFESGRFTQRFEAGILEHFPEIEDPNWRIQRKLMTYINDQLALENKQLKRKIEDMGNAFKEIVDKATTFLPKV